MGAQAEIPGTERVVIEEIEAAARKYRAAKVKNKKSTDAFSSARAELIETCGNFDLEDEGGVYVDSEGYSIKPTQKDGVTVTKMKEPEASE